MLFSDTRKYGVASGVLAIEQEPATNLVHDVDVNEARRFEKAQVGCAVEEPVLGTSERVAGGAFNPNGRKGGFCGILGEDRHRDPALAESGRKTRASR